MKYPGPELSPKATAAQKAKHTAAFRRWVEAEASRIRKQRRFLSKGQGPGIARLIEAMCDRAWELLDAGECEAADALLEFVPAERAKALLDEFFAE